MTAPVTTPAPTGCPGCTAPLTAGPSCPRCGLRLTGPDAARLWEVDLELARLDAGRHRLLAERGTLLAALRDGPVEVAPPAPAGLPAPRREWTPRRVQNLLLGLGGLLLALAAAVFAAVSYDRLGVGGRAAVLLALTALAGAAAPRLARRGLGATAETVTAVTLALAVLDAWGLRRLGLGGDLDDVAWAAAVSAVLAAGCAGYAAVVALRLPRLSAVVLAGLAALLGVVRLGPPATAAALLLALAAGTALGLVAALVGRERTAAVRDVAGAALAVAAALGTLAVLAAVVAAVGDGAVGAWALLGCAALPAAAAALARRPAARTALGALPVPLVAAATVVAVGPRVDDDVLPAVAGAVALVAVLATAVRGRAERPGPALGAALTTVGALAVVLEDVVAGLLLPLTWAADPWTLAAGSDARAAAAPGGSWDGSAVVPAVLALAAATSLAAGWLLGRRREGALGAGAAGTVAGLLVPLALDVAHPVAVLLLLAAAAGLLARADVARPDRAVAAGVLAAAAAAAGLATAWSLADRATTLAALPAAAALVALAGARPLLPRVVAPATAVAGLLALAEVVAAGAAADLDRAQVGGLLALGAAVAATAAAALRGDRRLGAEAAAAGGAVVAVGLAAADHGWLSWVLAGSGVVALAGALRRDRRALAPVGALLLTASSWVRLADAGVGDPEPYLVPLGLLALGLGHLRFRRDDAVRSQAAHGPGLALLLVPSALAALGEDGLARPLLLGCAALGVVLVGARTRLQAPLVIGAAVLAVVALDLLAPYAAAVPRWTALAAAGTLLVVVGATFEQRRQDVARLRERVAALR